MNKCLEISLLRGMHTAGQVSDLIRLLKHSDVILIEVVTRESYAKYWHKSFNRLSTDANYGAWVEANLDQYVKGNFAARLAWQLRGQGKRFYLVDKKFRNAQELGAIEPFYDITDLLELISTHPDRRYTILNQYIDRAIRQIEARDRLVARQVTRIVNKLSAQLPKERTEPYQIAVVQGFMHRIEPQLTALLPGVMIRERVFGSAAMRWIVRYDAGAWVLHRKLAKLDQDLSHKEIDYFLYRLLQYLQHPGPGFAAQSQQERLSELNDAGPDHPEFQWREHETHFRPISRYKGSELAAQVIELLRSY